MAIPTKLLDTATEIQARLLSGDLVGYKALIQQLALQGRVMPFSAPIVVTTLTSTVTNDRRIYKTPGGSIAIVTALRGFLHMTLPNSETTTFAANVLGNSVNATATFEDRLVVKAQNCRVVSLQTNAGGEFKDFVDTQVGNYTIFDWHPRWGGPFVLPAPKVLLETIEVTLTLEFISTVAAVIGAATNYGVGLDGVLLTER